MQDQRIDPPEPQRSEDPEFCPWCEGQITDGQEVGLRGRDYCGLACAVSAVVDRHGEGIIDRASAELVEAEAVVREYADALKRRRGSVQLRAVAAEVLGVGRG